MNLTTKLVFDYTKKQGEYNPVCSDGYIHIRFRDYTQPEVIKGFEKKLTFWLTNLMVNNWLPQNIESEDLIAEHPFKDTWEKYSKRFSTDLFFKLLEDAIAHTYKSKGIKLSPNYRKIAYSNSWRQFGSMTKGVGFNELPFGLALVDILFDDRIYFVIEKEDTTIEGSKFTNKTKRTNPKSSDFEQLSLW